jgi:hypothetical protein
MPDSTYIATRNPEPKVIRYLIVLQAINTKAAKRGTWYAVRVDADGDHTTLVQGVTKDAASAAAQADATRLGLASTYLRIVQD